MSSPIPGFKTLLMGGPGSGKTTSILSAARIAELEVFALFTEPGMNVVNRGAAVNAEFCERLIWRYLPPAAASWEDLERSAKLINTMANEALQKLAGINKTSYDQFIDFLGALHNFRDREGRQYGDVCEWGTNRLLFIDTLSGLNTMSKNLAIGSKPIMTQPDWGVSMDNLGRLVKKLCQDVSCHLVINAHIERETDEVSGQRWITLSTLGRKLAPEMVKDFDDIVLAYREGANFYWSTLNPNADLKARNLPLKDKMPQDFKQILDGWLKHGGVVSPERVIVEGLEKK